jgi:pimeloyl-ACP methyl ester carboxylesterase
MRRFLVRLLLAWFGWLLYVLLRRERVPRFDPPQAHPLRLPGRSVFVGDLEVFVREAGPPDAPPVLLVHGWGDHSLVVFHRIIPRLAEHFRVIAPDNRNTGKTDVVRGPYEIADLAADLAGLLDELDVGPVDLVGYSMGGMVAQELTRRRPDLVRRLVLAGTASVPPNLGGVRRRLAIPAIAAVRAGERLTRTVHTAARTSWLLRQGAVAPEHRRWAWTQHASRDPNLYWEAGAAVARWDSFGWVGDLAVPTLVIVNTADEVVATRAQYELAALIPGAEVVEVVHAHHAGPLTHDDVYAEAITRFLR